MFQMELFFGISGFCFYYTVDKGKSLGRIFKEKILRILVPYLAIAFVWLIPLRLFLHYPNYADKGIGEIIGSVLVMRDVGHLWFLPVLFILFILTSPIRKIRNVPILMGIGALAFFVSSFSSLIATLIIKLVCKYFFFFYAGYLFNLFLYNRPEKILRISFVGGFFFSLAIAICIKFGVINGMLESVRASMICCVIAILIPGVTSTAIEFFDRQSFGLYLLHSPLLIIGYQLFNYPPPLYLPLQLLIAFGISLGAIYLMRRSRLHFLLGEKYGGQ